MKTRSMTDLISLLSAATGPSRELDGEIALAFGLVPPGMERADDAWWGGGGEQWEAPSYTESIDAALTLVPKGLGVHLGRPLPKYCKEWYAELFAEGWSADRPDLLWTDGSNKPSELRNKSDYRPNAAIALVIACLKAMEDSKP